MYRTTISLAMLEVLFHQGLAIGMDEMSQSGVGVVKFNGPIMGDVNINIEENGGCCEGCCDDHGSNHEEPDHSDGDGGDN
jgi:hypothetical protein